MNTDVSEQHEFQTLTTDEGRSVHLIDTDVPRVRLLAAATATNGLQNHIVDLEEFDHWPRRPKGTRTVRTVTSFLTELARYPLGETAALWGKQKHSLIDAIYNDHTTDLPGWRDDILRLELAKDEDWLAWHRISGRYMPQDEFSDTIEELLHTVLRPDQAELMEIIESIRVTTGSTFESAVHRANGAQHLVYRENVDAKAGRASNLEVPQTITLLLPVFEGSQSRYEVEAWFRLRVRNGELGLAVKLKPTRQIELAGWRHVVEAIEKGLDRTVLDA
ncbi:DUF2303 family protein [Hoyosella altamirensis]|uniref:Uncharacterized protein YfdQ (DUF2303 family) n=1 Tax=Hoyosella altamirensis TaxID=616997 RepID=A0A839RV89_9ACTN|nr:DUF2303 family protein [Hoyosella altamirensis]MBB3040176.1 uncharacterized protein YfdQ (DUF2303 family) [Hoyosella altamirensis]